MQIKPYLKFFITNFLFWMLIFACSRAMFYLFQWQDVKSLPIADFAGSFLYGAYMDASFAGYISLAVSVIIMLTACFSAKWTRLSIYGITLVLLFLHAFLSVADGELFKAWGFRIDIMPLMYLDNPGDALASVSVWRLILLIALVLMLFAGLVWIFRVLLYRILPKEGRASFWNAPIFLILSGLCIIPMRGGFDTAPMNQGSVFFSSQALANQAALNMPWNLMYSVANRNEFTVYKFMSDQEAEQLANDFLKEPDNPSIEVLNTKRPNVIVVIMESFSSALVEQLGGEKGATPRFSALTEEGLLFTNFYADGYRTERGLVSILSGYPSQPTRSVIRINNKLNKIPMLARDFKQQGYRTAFYYGGDINFVNTRGYVLTAGFERYTDKSDFPESPKFSWGAHDEAVYRKMLDDLDTVNSPFFYSILTLSNHEPHIVPIPNVSEDNGWLNSVYYADKCIGDFVDEAKTKSWWANTLLIFVADHGIRFVSGLPNYDEHAFQIPMLWVGGALNVHNMRVDKLGSQRDIAATLLSQLGMPTTAYKFSDNLLNPDKSNFAFYTYKNGFGFVKDSTVAVFDNDVQNMVRELNSDSTSVKQAKALFQVMNDDFLGL